MIFESVKNDIKYTFDREYSIEMISETEDLTLLEGYLSQIPFVAPILQNIDPFTQLVNDKRFGSIIMDQLLVALKAQNIPLTDSLNLVQKLNEIQNLLTLGAINEAGLVLNGIAVDTILTQEIKDSFLNQINDYLMQPMN